MIEDIAWLILRVVFAWMFIYPLKNLMKDIPASKELVTLICPIFQGFITWLMFFVMFFGGVSILLGAYAQIGGFLLCIYSLIGIKVHFACAKNAKGLSGKDKEFKTAQELAIVGHVTSGQKNIVLAAVALFFTLLGSGPYSLTVNLF